MDKPVLSQEKFIDIMKDIIKARRFENDLFDFMWRNADGYGAITFPTSTDVAIDLLAFVFDDNESWIDYYVYELSCGENYKPGMIHDDSGNDMPLATPADLYNLLIKELEDK